MAFEWLVKLNDAFTDPATRVQKSIRNVTASLRELQAVQKEGRALDAYVRSNNPGLRTSVRDAARVKGDLLMGQAELLQLRNKKAALDNTGSAWSSFTNRMKENRQAIRDWLIIAQPITQVLGFLAGFTMKAANLIFPVEKIGDAIKTRQDARIGFENAFGSKSEQMLQMTQDVATRTGQPVGELFGQANRYGNIGAKAEEIRPMLLAIGDAKVMNLEVGKLERVFEATFSKPVGTIREIFEGLKGVLNETVLWKHLTEDIGITLGRKIEPGEAERMYREHRIGGSFIRNAVEETIQDREGGKLGSTAFRRADTTLGGSLDTFEQRMINIYANVEKSQGFKTFKSAFDNILTSLGSEKFQKLVDNIANRLGAAFEPLTGPNGKERIDNFFERISLGIQKVLPFLTMMAKATVDLTKWFAPTPADIADDLIQEEKQRKFNEDMDKRGAAKLKKGILGTVGLGHTEDEFPDYDMPQGPTFTVGGKKLGIVEYFQLKDDYKKLTGKNMQSVHPDGTDYYIGSNKVSKKAYDLNQSSDWVRPSHSQTYGDIHVVVNVHATGNQDHKAIGQAAKEGTTEALADALDKMNVEHP